MKIYENEHGVLYQGDCLQIMPSLPIVDMVLTDPPFGTTACSWDTVIPFAEMWERINALTNDNTPIALFGCEPFSSLLNVSNIKDFRYAWYGKNIKGRGF